MVSSEPVDGDSQPASKTYSLLQKEKKADAELDDFVDIDAPDAKDSPGLADVIKKQPAKKNADPENKKGKPELIDSNVN